MLTFTQRLDSQTVTSVSFTLFLTAVERTRSRHRFDTPDGHALFLRLPRGTVLQDGDVLQAVTGETVRIIAKPEPVLTVTATTPLNLLRAAYHLGNRHVPLEVNLTYLRLSPNSVLETLLQQLGVEVQEEIAPFFPELGAYGHSHAHE